MLTDATDVRTDAPNKTPRKRPNRRRDASPTQQLLTGTQVEREYGIPYRSLYDLYIQGLIAAVRFTEKGRLRWRRKDIEALIERSLATA